MVPISVNVTTDSNATGACTSAELEFEAAPALMDEDAAGEAAPHIDETKSLDNSKASALESALKARVRELEVQNSSLLDRLASLEQVVFPTAGR